MTATGRGRRLPRHRPRLVASARSTPFEGLLGPMARESTLVAVLGDLDPRSLHLLAGVHPRGTSSTALALLLDTPTWARGPGHRAVAVRARRCTTRRACCARPAGRRWSCAAARAWPRRCRRLLAPHAGALMSAGPAMSAASSGRADDRTLPKPRPAPCRRIGARRRRAAATCGAPCWPCSRARSACSRCAELFTDRGWLIDVWLSMLVVVGPAARAAPHPAGHGRPDLDRRRPARSLADRQLRPRARGARQSCRSPAPGTTSAG